MMDKKVEKKAKAVSQLNPKNFMPNGLLPISKRRM
jgi:hypothetical protein